MTNKKKGLILLIVPIASLFIILFAYTIANFVISSVVGSTGAPVVVVAQIINVVLGLFGLLAVIGIFVGIPLGIYFLSKGDEKNNLAKIQELKKDPKYATLTDEQIVFISKWSWGAFFATGIWSLGNKLYSWAIPYLVLVALGVLEMVLINFSQTSYLDSPFFIFIRIITGLLGFANLFIWIYISIKGRQLAWEKGWDNFDQFKQRQSLMSKIIAAFIVVMIILNIVVIWRGFNNITNPELSDYDKCFIECVNTTNTELDLKNCAEACPLSEFK